MRQVVRWATAPAIVVTLVAALVGMIEPSEASVTNPGAIDKAPSVWLDASDPDADGIAGNNPADGDSISVWKDKSGNGNDAQLLEGWTPATYQTQGTEEFNSQPTLHFNRIDDNVGTGLVVPVDGRASVTPNLTVFAVYQPTANTPNNGVWGMDNGDWDRFFISYHSNFGDGEYDGVVATGPTTIGVTVTGAGLPNQPRLSAVRYAGNIVDGENEGTPNGSAVFFDGDLITRFTDRTDAYDAQSHIVIGSDGDNSAFEGDIAEVLIYPYALTDAEIRAVSAYIHDTYEVAKTPVAISAAAEDLFEGTDIGELGFVTEPATTLADWEIAPVCQIFALNDTEFDTPLTGVLPKGRYLTHCSGGLSADYATSEYITGSLRIKSRYAVNKATVFFDPYSAELSSSAKQALRALVRRSADSHLSAVTVRGYVRPTAVTSNDASLSRARAQAVARYLRRLGIEVTIDAKGLGSAGFNGPSARKAVTWFELDFNPGK